jgi:hypothetical protein
MSPVGFEPGISAGERPQIYALDLVTTVADFKRCTFVKISWIYRQLIAGSYIFLLGYSYYCTCDV